MPHIREQQFFLTRWALGCLPVILMCSFQTRFNDGYAERFVLYLALSDCYINRYKSALVEGMASRQKCFHTTSHYLNQCSLRSTPFGVTRPGWVKNSKSSIYRYTSMCVFVYLMYDLSDIFAILSFLEFYMSSDSFRISKTIPCKTKQWIV